MLRSRNWIRNLKRSLLRESLERDANAPRREARRPHFEPLEDRRVMAVAVEAFSPTPSGFTAQLTEEIRVENLNLYDTQGEAMGAADVTLRGETVGDVRGSLIVRGTELMFVATGGVLAPDTYVATLRSASDAIVDEALGELLDGDGDGTPGGDYTFSFTVSAGAAVVVGLPDFSRGPTQSVNVPAVGSGQAPLEGLPIRLSETAGVTSMTMTITYDPAMLDVSEVRLGTDAPNGSQVEANLTVPGQITLAFFSLDPMTGGEADLLEIVASVPEDAPYAEAHVLRVASVEINAGLIDAVGDDAVHVVAFPGDANANRRYDAEDARLIARVGVELDSGFVNHVPTGNGSENNGRLYPLIDPIIIGDVTGLDGISPLDASDILRRVVGLSTPNIPALPAAQAPTAVALSTTTIAEGQPVGTTVATLSTSDPDPQDTHTYSLVAGEGDDDNEFFSISGSSLRTTAVFDASVKNSYRIRVQTTDSTGRTLQRTFTLTITAANQAPTAIALDGTTIAENVAEGTVVGELSTTDPNAGDTHTYTLVNGEGASDNAAFQIVNNTLVTAEPIDFEEQSSYSVRIRSTDAAGLFTESVFVITVTDVNETPSGIALSDNEVDEDAPVGTVVGGLSTTDPDAEDTHTYSLVAGEGDADNASFTISGQNLVIAEALDFETQDSYTVRVRSTDAGGLSTEQVFVITLTGVNDAPTDLALDNTTVAEDAEVGTVVGTLSATDPDAGDTHSYSLVDGEGDSDNAQFTISGSTLVIAEALDFEAQESYSVRVRVTDAGGLFTEKVFVITAATAAENSAPTAVALDNTEVAGDAEVGTVVGTLTATDADAGDTHSYSLVDGEGDTDNALFTISGSTLVIAEALDFEAQESYSVRVRVTDAGGLFTEAVFVITATTAVENSAPTELAIDNNEVAEDAEVGTVVGNLTATDPDAGDTHSYELVGGEGDGDNSLFTISGNTLVIAEALDFEAQESYSVRVRVTDAGGLFTEAVFVITAATAAENSAPTDLAIDNTEVAGDAEVGTVVGNLTATDADAGDTHSYSLVDGEGDGDNAQFTISGSTLVIAEALDFEAQESYSVRVRVTDAGGLSTEAVFVITAATAAENSAPTDLAIDNTEVAGDAEVGTVVGNLTATDADADDTHSYELVGGEGATDNALFTISGNTLVIAEALDFEAQESYSVRVRVTDAGGLFTEAVFVITATTAVENSAPTELAIDNTEVAEDAEVGTVVGTLSATDADAGDTHSYELISGEGDTDNALFAISGDTLVIAEALDFEAQESYSVRVRVTDAGGLFTEAVFVITATTAVENSAPTELAIDNNEVAEDAEVGTVVGTLSAIDADAGDTHSYALISGEGDSDNALFAISGDTLVIAEALDFEAQESYSVRVRVTDAGGLFTEAVFVITAVTAAENSAPTELAIDNTEVAGDAEVGAVVGTLSATDADAGDTHSYALISGEGDSDNALFAISGDTLVIAEALDFEAQESYSVRVRVTDAGGLFTEAVFVITATTAAENSAPTELAIDNTEVAGDAEVGAVVGTLSATDADAGDTHSYALISGEGDTDNALFAISGNTLVIAEALDFEAQESYSVRVRVTDAGGLFTEAVFVVTAVTAAENSAPAELAIDNTEVAEDAEVGTVVGTLSATDPDAGDTHSYELISGEGDSDNALFAISGDTLVIAEALDFEAQESYSVRVRVTDAGGLSTEAVFVITAATAAENSAPTELALDNTEVAEDAEVGTVVGTLSATDADAGDTHSYSLVDGEGGTDNEWFMIVGNSLVVCEPLDFEAQDSYSVRVRATDAGGLFTEDSFLITLAGANQAPTQIALDNLTAANMSPAGTVIGGLSTVDPNTSDTHAYELVQGEGDTHNVYFAIVNNELHAADTLDLGAIPEFSIRIRSVDQDGLAVEQVFLITEAVAQEAT